MGIQKKRLALMVLAMFSLSTAMVFFMRTAFDSCSSSSSAGSGFGGERESGENEAVRSATSARNEGPNPLEFMKSKLVLLVSHELSLSGTVSLT